jgi:hypothetical protein
VSLADGRLTNQTKHAMNVAIIYSPLIPAKIYSVCLFICCMLFAEKFTPPPSVTNLQLPAESTPVGGSVQLTPAFNSISLKAAKMKGGLVNALKEVGDKVQKLPLPTIIPMQVISKHENSSSVSSSSSRCEDDGQVSVIGNRINIDHGVSGWSTDSVDGRVTNIPSQIIVQSNEVNPAFNTSVHAARASDASSPESSAPSVQVSSAARDSVLNANGGKQCKSVADSDAASACDDCLGLQQSAGLGNQHVDSLLLQERAESGENLSAESRCSSDVHTRDSGSRASVFVKPGERLNDDGSSVYNVVTPGSVDSVVVKPRVFSVAPEENTGDIIFCSKRSSTRRTKRTVSKQACTCEFFVMK